MSKRIADMRIWSSPNGQSVFPLYDADGNISGHASYLVTPADPDLFGRTSGFYKFAFDPEKTTIEKARQDFSQWLDENGPR